MEMDKVKVRSYDKYRDHFTAAVNPSVGAALAARLPNRKVSNDGGRDFPFTHHRVRHSVKAGTESPRATDREQGNFALQPAAKQINYNQWYSLSSRREFFPAPCRATFMLIYAALPPLLPLPV